MHVSEKGFSAVMDRNFYGKRRSAAAAKFHKMARRSFEEKVLRPAREERENYRPVVLQALDELGIALADHGHKWTPRQRRLYERATAQLLRKS